ncbi:LytTR family DNA-binding domain-containing protein [Neobacillus sp. WH10]|uniref:LytR/AlgR family response regulator transcription factor n=1 Tax=Neobacillus sp. WH10 TaxID=3047873 RepID=UPI0024C20BDE|nr:LytTR family DNA-binding domain-containing protein [Neobacillus sp. WH10]WHY77394.1 LytTR family DNA-binding domain-containing protein [Neobacillus sp. WH10]
MKRIKIVVADDDQASIDMIKSLVKNLSDFQLIGQCINGEQLIEEVMVKKPDLVLTTVTLLKKNGIQAIKECLSFFSAMKVIFIADNNEYAIEAFDIAAVDYIVKPVSKERLGQALEKANNIISFERDKTGTGHKSQQKILPLRDQNATFFIPLSDICFIEKVGKKCLVYTTTEIYDTYETMARILERLDVSFFHAHRSYIINLAKISQITPQKESFIVHFNDTDKLAKISKLKINELRERIALLSHG